MFSKHDLGWKRALAELPEAALAAMALSGADDPIVWAGLDSCGAAALTDHGRCGDCCVQYLDDCCGPLDHDRLTWAGLLPELNALLLAAQRPCKAHVQRVARMTGLQVSVDHSERMQAASEQQEVRTLKRLEAFSAPPLPWQPTKIRRTEDKVPDARAKAEKAERARWAAEVVKVLIDTDLPYAQTLGSGEPDLRCCRGLAFRTLAKRVRGIRPMLRFVRAQYGSTFPASEEQVLAYFAARAKGAAPKSAFSDALDSLKFFEDAGELPEADRLSSRAAVVNAAAEARSFAAHNVESGRRGGQAPPLPLRLIVAIEQVVMDTELQPFIRLYGWYRLFRFWTSMRFDDTMGVKPGSLSLRSRGVAGKLERTKTSGPGKTVQVLPFFIAFNAFVDEAEWLRTGLALLEQEFSFERDYLLPLPNADFSGARKARAVYSDAMGFSRQLLLGLEDFDQSALVPPLVAGYFTEHSDRGGLDSWCAALQVGKWRRDFLGRWAASGSADKYVRTALRVVESLQCQAAAAARKVWAGGPDLFGEEHLLAELHAFLLEKGADQEEAKEWCSKLVVADTALPVYDRLLSEALEGAGRQLEGPDDEPEPVDGIATPRAVWLSPFVPRADAPDTGLWMSPFDPSFAEVLRGGESPLIQEASEEGADFQEAESDKLSSHPTILVDGPGEEPEVDTELEDVATEGAEPTELGDAPPGVHGRSINWGLGVDAQQVLLGNPADVSDAEIEEVRGLQLEDRDVTPHGFVVASTSKKVKRLHFVGNCRLIPGLDYYDFVVHGEECPQSALFDRYCLNCFPEHKGRVEFMDEEVVESTDSEATTSSSSTSS